MVTVLQCPGRELSHVTGKHELFLYIYQVISLLQPLQLIK